MNKQMITRTTDRRALGAREISLFCHLLFSQTLSLYEKKLERAERERREREREIFLKKNVRVVYNNKQHREENSLRETLEEAPRTESKKSTRSVPSTLFSRSSRRREQKTHGGHIGETRGSFFVFV